MEPADVGLLGVAAEASAALAVPEVSLQAAADHLAPDARPRVGVGPMLEQQPHDPGVALRRGPHQRGLAFRSLASVHFHATVEERLDGVHPAGARTGHQRGLAGSQRRSRIGARRQQPLHHRPARVRAGQPKGRDLVVVGGVDAGAGADEQFRRLLLVPVDGPVQRRRTVSLGRIRVGSVRQQRTHGSPFLRLDGLHEAQVVARGLKTPATQGHEAGDERQPACP